MNTERNFFLSLVMLIFCSASSAVAESDTGQKAVEFEDSPQGSAGIVWEKGPFPIQIEPSAEGEKRVVTLHGTLLLKDSSMVQVPGQEYQIKDELSKEPPVGRPFIAKFTLEKETTPIVIHIVDSLGNQQMQSFELIEKTISRRFWEPQLELEAPFGSYVEIRPSGTSATTTVSGAVYGLTGSLSTYKAGTKRERAFELSVSGSIAFMNSLNGVSFPPPWRAGLYGVFRNLSKLGSPFLGLQFQSLPLGASLFGASPSGEVYQYQTISLFWTTLGWRSKFSIFEFTPHFSYCPYSVSGFSVNGGSGYLHTGWKIGARMSADLFKGLYLGGELDYLTLSGDSQISSTIGSALLGYHF